MRKFLASFFDRIPAFRGYRMNGLLAEFSRAASETDSTNAGRVSLKSYQWETL